MGDRLHPWENHNDSCECHIGICGDCGCTNESAAPQPLDVERLAAALHDDWEANHDLPWRCMNDPEKRKKHVAVYFPRAERLLARLGSQEGSE